MDQIKEWKVKQLSIYTSHRQELLKDISHIHFLQLTILNLWDNDLLSMELICRIQMPQLHSLYLSEKSLIWVKEMRKVKWAELASFYPCLRYYQLLFKVICLMLNFLLSATFLKYRAYIFLNLKTQCLQSCQKQRAFLFRRSRLVGHMPSIHQLQKEKLDPSTLLYLTIDLFSHFLSFLNLYFSKVRVLQNISSSVAPLKITIEFLLFDFYNFLFHIIKFISLMLTSNLFKKHISKQTKSQVTSQNSLNKLSETISQLSQSFQNILENNLSRNISQLNSNIEKLTNHNFDQYSLRFNSQNMKNNHQYEEKIESRFEIIEVSIPKVQLSDENREKKIKKWLGSMMKQATSTSFEKFVKGELKQKATKAYCSENIILNILKFFHSNEMSKSDMDLINTTLRDTILPYIKIKYPQSEDAEVNLAFKKRVAQINDFQNNENDLFFKSGINFQYSQDKDYSGKIMQLLNFIIKLPEKLINVNKSDNILTQKSEKCQNSELSFETSQTSLNHYFQKVFEDLFESIGDEEKVQAMRNRKNREKVQNSKIDEKQKQKYKEKVSSYSKYLIGRKLSQNLKPFSASDIKDGKMQLSNSALMRIVTKWCQQLRQNFSDPHKIAHKHSQFRMKDGSERYLSVNESNILHQILSEKEKEIKKWISRVNQDNFQHQHDFSKIELLLDSDLEIFSAEESIVGIFSSITRKNYQTYLIGYLKELIHNLLKVMEEFEALAYYRDGYRYWSQINYQKSMVNEGKNIKKQKKQSKDSEVPNLLTFKLSDLLRCKCSSRQMEINAIYNEIQRINEQEPELLKIVKVKNRLERGTRDVLMNLMFKNQIVIELQLAVNTNKSNFTDCSDKFNHFIYELQRAEFGPISEMCNIWTNIDQRASFFMKQFNKRNSGKNTGSNSIHQQRVLLGEKGYQKIILPFRCDKCGIFYSNTLFIGDHRKYILNRFQICFPCILKELKNYSKIKQKILPDLPILNDKDEKYDIEPLQEMSTDQFPSFGLLIKLNSKNKEVKYFKTIKRGNKKLVIEKSQSKFHVLGNVTGKKEIKAFLKENLIFSSPYLEQKCKEINLQEAVKQFFIPEVFEETLISQKNSVKINFEKLNDNVISKLKQPLKEVKTVNFSQNQITTVSQITKNFPNLNTLILQINPIQNLTGLSSLQQLRQLNLSRDSIKNLPEELKYLKKLEKLNLSSNLISQLTGSICLLTRLKELNLNENRLQKLPAQFGQLTSLQILTLQMNKLGEIPQSFHQLRNLITLYLYSNKLNCLPENFGEMKSLRNLYISLNKLKNIPDSFINLTNLQILYLHANLLQELPKGFGELKKIYILYIFENKIQHLKEQMMNLENLIQFRDEDNKFDQQSKAISLKLHSLCQQNEKKKQKIRK